MSILSRLMQAKECLPTVFAAASRRHGFVVAFWRSPASRPPIRRRLSGGRFVEADGWKARITVDCLLKDKLCGSFRYETLACEGDLIYSGEIPTGFEFRTELRAGRCLPGCLLQISSDFKRYAEVCRDSRHEGALTAVAARRRRAAAPAPATAPPRRHARAAPAPQAAASAKGPTGQVRFKWDNGDVFDGQMLDGKRNGKGRMVWASGQSYDGDWRDDVPVGEGAMVFVNGDRYQGQVRDGIPEGRGKKQFANGDTYEGQFNHGIADGEGVHTQKDGSRYTGQWKAGIKQRPRQVRLGQRAELRRRLGRRQARGQGDPDLRQRRPLRGPGQQRPAPGQGRQDLCLAGPLRRRLRAGRGAGRGSLSLEERRRLHGQLAEGQEGRQGPLPVGQRRLLGRRVRRRQENRGRSPVLHAESGRLRRGGHQARQSGRRPGGPGRGQRGQCARRQDRANDRWTAASCSPFRWWPGRCAIARASRAATARRGWSTMC